ncbi:GNAT family N-acetyltransferase, partial [Bacteroidota bacterium]
MEKEVKLKDGSEVLVRDLNSNDVEKSFAFFQKLPVEDRIYLRVDVTKKENVEKRIKIMNYQRVKRLSAFYNNEIVADGALELEGHGWKEHTAELRLIVAEDFRRKGLGIILAGELFNLGLKEGVEEILVKMMKPQAAAQSIFHRLGFHHDIVLSNYVKDQSGKKQDLIIMRCSLKDLWEELEDYFHEKDYR